MKLAERDGPTVCYFAIAPGHHSVEMSGCMCMYVSVHMDLSAKVAAGSVNTHLLTSEKPSAVFVTGLYAFS